MGVANDLVDDLVSRPLTSEEIQRRREAAKPATRLVGTLDGQLVEPAPTPAQAPRVVQQAPQQTWD
jgi:hypothetical protein